MTIKSKIEARIARAEKATDNNSEHFLSTNNIKKLKTFNARVSNKQVAAFLKQCEFKESDCEKAVYSLEKLATYSLNALQVATKINPMNRAVLLTVLRFAANDLKMTIHDARDACSADRKVASDKKKLIVQRKETTDESTVKAQAQSSMHALVMLNVLKFADNQYSIDKSSVAFKQLSSFAEQHLM